MSLSFSANFETESIRDLCLRALCRMSLTCRIVFTRFEGAVRLISEMMRREVTRCPNELYLVLYLLSADKHARHKLMEQNVVDIRIRLSSWVKIDNYKALS